MTRTVKSYSLLPEAIQRLAEIALSEDRSASRVLERLILTPPADLGFAPISGSEQRTENIADEFAPRLPVPAPKSGGRSERGPALTEAVGVFVQGGSRVGKSVLHSKPADPPTLAPPVESPPQTTTINTPAEVEQALRAKMKPVGKPHVHRQTIQKPGWKR